MSGQPAFFRAKRVTYFHTSHKTIFDGTEITHVKSNLTASVDGNHKVKADVHHVVPRASFDGAVALGGNVTVTGNLSVTGSMIVTSSVLHQGDNVFGDQDADNHKFFGTTTASGGVFISGSLIGQANASVDGNFTLGGNLSVTGKNTVTSSVIGQANASLDGTLAVGGNITAPAITLTSSLLANANASVDGNMVIGGDNTVGGKNTVTSSIIGQSNASIDGNAAIGGDVKYNKFETGASAMGIMTVSGITGIGLVGVSDGMVKIWDIGNATTIYVPYWNRST